MVLAIPGEFHAFPVQWLITCMCACMYTHIHVHTCRYVIMYRTVCSRKACGSAWPVVVFAVSVVCVGNPGTSGMQDVTC